MVILHILAPGPVGGLERVVRSLAVGHRAMGDRVCAALVLDRAAPEPELRHQLEDAGVEVEAIPLGPRSYLAERAAIAALCERLQPDVVHTHGYRTDVADAGVARRLGFPTVTTVHGFTGGGWKNRLFERLQRHAFRRFSAVVAVSAPLYDVLLRAGAPRDRLHTIRNAWDGAVSFLDRPAARRALGLRSDEGGEADVFCIGWVGRLSREKGADVLIDALGQLSDLDVSASIIGEGEELEGLQRRARRVTWHGTVPEAARLFPAFDAFVLSSRTEGTPMVLLEAMAAGVPIIATAVGGVPDVVTPAEALLVPSDDPRALADAVRCVVRDPEGVRLRVEAARQRVARDFALQPWLGLYAALYRSVQSGAPALAAAAG